MIARMLEARWSTEQQIVIQYQTDTQAGDVKNLWQWCCKHKRTAHQFFCQNCFHLHERFAHDDDDIKEMQGLLEVDIPTKIQFRLGSMIKVGTSPCDPIDQTQQTIMSRVKLLFPSRNSHI